MNLDIIQIIKKARADDGLRALAGKLAADLIAQAFADNHDRKAGTLRGSESGNCARQVWADVHGLYDIDEDVESQLCSMDRGTMLGAWYAALLSLALENDGFETYLEEEVDDDAFTGHIDLVIARYGRKIHRGEEGPRGGPVMVVEFKTTAVMGQPRDPMQPNKTKGALGTYEDRSYHVLQAVKYALRVGAPIATVITASASGMRQDDYDVEEWRARAEADDARLSKALLDEMPEADPQQGFRCASCRYGACEMNKNKLREIAA